ncbi:MFS transporter [Altericroceibacterium endophyticum]|uniref:MFS transporter n=1 Tax=Altericroceibacterium endophyticum TaxID=1808508 RepID=A0A6I4T5M8_9SPHN|nr:MFS transporter [Altericroceibacterium endophyticum]MXO66157.1 MFS transporter [Altericroceibacterium endophyticum]
MARFDIERFVDDQRIGPVQLTVLLVCGLVCFIDGFDIFMVGKIAPAIAESYGQPPEAMTELFVFQQVGLAIGAFTVSPLADRFGRRFMLMACCAIFGVITLLSTQAETLLHLSILRGLAGIFMAAGLPMALALISETTPKRKRSTFVALALAGYSSGSAASGAVAAWLLDSYGWQSGFWIGGLVPLLCVPLLMFVVPESLKFRAERNPKDPTLAATIRRMDPRVSLSGDEFFALGQEQDKAQKAKLSDVFTNGRGLMTMIIWSACLLSMTSIALMAAWLPTFFQEMANIPIQRFAVSAMIAYLGGVTGTLTIGYLMDKFDATKMIPIFYIGLACTMIAISLIPFESAIFMPVLILWSFLQTGGQAGLNTFITQIYPPRMRSTALGWAGGAGRVGGVLAPIYGGIAIGNNFTLQLTLGLAAIVPFVVAVLVFLLGRTQQVKDYQGAKAALA